MSSVGTKNSVCSGHGGFPSRPPAEAVDFFTVNGIPVLVDGNAYAVKVRRHFNNR